MSESADAMEMTSSPGRLAKAPPNTPNLDRRPSSTSDLQDLQKLTRLTSAQEGNPARDSADSGPPSLKRRESMSSIDLTSLRRLSISAGENISASVAYSVEWISSFWVVVTIVTLFTFGFTLFAIIYLNYNEIRHPGQVELIGTSVNHVLTIHSSSASAELKLLSGFDKGETVALSLDPEGNVGLYRQSELDDDQPPLLEISRSGTTEIREDLITKKSVMAGALYAENDGIHFPDGSVMTTAAETSVGIKSESDLNIVAGVNNSLSDSAIFMTVASRERMRVSRSGIFFRSHLSSDSGDGSEQYDESIAIYPEKKEIEIGNLHLTPEGLRTSDISDSINMYASALVLNDTSSSPNGATITVSSAKHMSTGQPFVISGQEAVLTGGAISMVGGWGSEKGGDLNVNGGFGGRRNGNVNIGSTSSETKVLSNRTEIVSPEQVSIKSGLLSVHAPVVFESEYTTFSNDALRQGAGFTLSAKVTTSNITVSPSPDTYYDVGGVMTNANLRPDSGGFWGVADGCTSCITYGGPGGFADRPGMFALLAEAVSAPGEFNITRRIGVTCIVSKIGANYNEEKVGSGIESEEVVLSAGSAFFQGDEPVSISGSKIAMVEGGAQYGVLCKVRGDADVNILRVTLSIML